MSGGDTIVITKLDRLGRSLREILNTSDELARREVDLVSLGDPIDTINALGRAYSEMIGLFVKLERSFIIERTSAGRKVAMAKGVKFGRKPKLTPEQVEQAKDLLTTDKYTVAAVANGLGVHRGTLWRYLEGSSVRSVADPPGKELVKAC